MLSDPQSITVTGLNAGAAMSFPKIVQADKASTYHWEAADGSVRLELQVSHQETGKDRVRRQVRLVQTKLSVDALTEQNELNSLTVYFVVDEPLAGDFTDTEVDNLFQALKTWASSATVLKVVGGQH